MYVYTMFSVFQEVPKNKGGNHPSGMENFAGELFYWVVGI